MNVTGTSILTDGEREALLALCSRRRAKFGRKWRVDLFHVHKRVDFCENRNTPIADRQQSSFLGADSTQGGSA